MFHKKDYSQYEYRYNDAQPTGIIPWEQPRKPKRRWPKVMAVILSAALLVGGGFGAGWFISERADQAGRPDPTQILVSDRQGMDVETISVTGNQKLTYPEIYAANVESCVSIYAVMRSSAGYNIFGQSVIQASSGSGFVITKDGYIVTNYHVIDGSSSVEVTFSDGSTYDAQVVGGDADYDVAVLKIEPGEKELRPVVINAGGSLLVGEEIMTIGNPLGELTFSLSDGRVSCLDREINVDGTPFNMIQITAPVNHGNSGGPLFNLYGEVVGIVSAKYGNTTSSDSVEGLGFAIPIEDVLVMIEDIIENGQVTSHAWIGIAGGDAARYPQGGVSHGAYITEVTPGGPAEAAGLQAGDVITMLGTTQIANFDSLKSAIGSKSYRAGDTTTVTYVRAGRVYTTELTFGSTVDMPEDAAAPSGQEEQQGQSYPYGDMSDFFDRFFGGAYGYGH